MTPTPIYVQYGPPEWWQVLAAVGPWVVLLAASVLGVMWWRLALRRETRAVSRNDQWDRVVWAIEASVDANPQKRSAGRAALDVLSREAVAGSDEAKIIAQARQGNSGRNGGAGV
ncbi:hypothetical protein [Pseudarthrobacter phenanthrenivorans]|uniref:hypothetical protein n=1 Tax=Pseudarthrobacter phenanthrenivorans TaxID=361575 RepID=UPI0012E073F2|nr:hypothetical protein [Pseudarthrobacter phenanthrenivorans]